MKRLETDILIVGGGAAGLAAAASVTDKKVLIADDNPQVGGQIWRAEMGRLKSPEALRLVEKIDRREISVLNNASVFGFENNRILLAETPDGALGLKFEKLILATGARERFLPFAGWTLPNVFGAGGLQALVKSGFSVENKRIVVAGTGPLLLAVAEYLRSKGGRVLLIAEQTSRRRLFNFGLGLWRTPSKLVQAVRLKTKLFGVPFLADSFVVSAEGRDRLTAVNLRRRGRLERVECDLLACGFHLVPNIEPAVLMNCALENGFVKVDEFQRTSQADVFCAGEPTGIGGVELALVEGRIAGLAAGGRTNEARELFAERAKLQKFAERLNDCFRLQDKLKSLPEADTIICRCEDVRLRDLAGFENFREAKLQTRCGMGACQGRVCGASLEFLMNWKRDTVRPPVFPVRMKSLAD